MNTRKGFTLIELLSVISIMTVVMALTIPALHSSNASLLSTSGARLSGLLEASRQTAILTRQPVAVAMLPADTNSVQRFAALGYSGTSGTGSWKQISKWDSFSPGILADAGDNMDGWGNTLNAFQPSNSPAVSTALPNLVYSGKTYKPSVESAGSGYGYVIFLPDGSLFQDSTGHPTVPCIVRIVQGTADGKGGINGYTGIKNASGKPVNYFDIVMNDATGQVKVVRP